ncbi:MAG TPA: hypothetical protein VJT09_02615 [Pyrinomonadaceae bacterium]|nr:hypothetical protein [Pyrinomonadaceae bacterium]
MNSSRRKFIKGGIVAAAFATLPLKSALAEIRPEIKPGSSSGSVDQLSYYTESTFAPYVNTDFLVHLDPSNVRELKLVKVSNYLDSLSQMDAMAQSSATVCFSLLFATSQGQSFEQSTYLMGHEALGSFYLFVVPVGEQNKKSRNYYEAIIYRRHQYTSWDDARGATETQPTVAVVTPARPKRNQQRVDGGVPLVILPGGVDASPDAKKERDIYRFRPEKTEPPAAAKSNNSAAPQRIIHPLTLAQAPDINGLKLGMTAEQVLALFPGSKTDEAVRSELSRPPSRFGVSGFTITPAKYSSGPKFSRVSQIFFTLLDGRVSTLYVGYDGPLWEDVDQFVTKFSKKRNLPGAEQWEAHVGMDTQLKTLKCQELEISLFAGGSNVSINYAQMRDLVALKKYRERRLKAKEKETNG